MKKDLQTRIEGTLADVIATGFAVIVAILIIAALELWIFR